MPDIPEIPADLSALNRDQLVELEGTLLSRFESLREDTSAEAVEEMARIAETLPAIGDRVDSIDAEARRAADAAAAVERYQSRRTPPEPEPEPEPEPVADVQPEPELIDDQPGTEVVPVASSRTSLAEIARRAPKPKAPADRPESRWFTSLTAGAEIPGVPASAAFQSAGQLAEAVLNRTQALTRTNSESASAMIARAHLPQLGDVIGANESASYVTVKMLEAVQRWRDDQERQALSADTGLCAPTETVYDLCDVGTVDGLISLPEIAINRGGLSFFKLPDFACFDNYGWEFGPDPDELECMDKPCQEIPCPETEDVTPSVIGACLKAGILQARQFPELVELYVRNVFKAHQVRISRRTLQLMEAGSIPVVYDDVLLGGSGFTAALFNAINVQAEDVRDDYMLGMTETVTVVLPRWVRGAIRADLANRMGVDLLGISDQRIDQMFRDAGVVVEWVKNWQNECIGAPGAQRAYPTTVKFLIYREGAWVRGLEPVIELESQYDSVLLRQNKFTRLFTEQMLMVANLCTTSRVVTVPVCPNGRTNAGGPVACFSEACTTTPVVCPPNVDCPPLPCCGDDGTTPPAPAPAP